jgi:uncharacterized membrane protein YeaQ/YmgE (transglycosylase-associated protein family)
MYSYDRKQPLDVQEKVLHERGQVKWYDTGHELNDVQALLLPARGGLSWNSEERDMLLANYELDPGSVVAWLVVGLIVGRLAGKVMQNPGHGIIGDLWLGLIGAAVGGALPSLFMTGRDQTRRKTLL